MLGFFMLQVIGGMIRREPAALSRAALGLAKSILGSFVALALLGTALEITDQLCIGIVNAAGTNMNEMGDQIAVLAAGLGTHQPRRSRRGRDLHDLPRQPRHRGAMVVWISLLIRKALLLIAIVFAPIALAGSSWDHTRSWVSRWATFVIALILSKVVLVVIFLLATAQVSAPIDADLESVSQPMAGVVLMLMAGFAPYLTYKAISFMGFDMYHAMSAEQEAKASLNRPMPIPLSRRSGSEPAKILGDGGGGAGTTAGGSAAGSALGRWLDARCWRRRCGWSVGRRCGSGGWRRRGVRGRRGQGGCRRRTATRRVRGSASDRTDRRPRIGRALGTSRRRSQTPPSPSPPDGSDPP